jgi:outer membrane protein
MSGKPTWFVAVQACAAGLFLFALAVPVDTWAFDPLFTMPAVVETGKPLPGDADTVRCPVRKDFSLTLGLGDALDLGLCNNPQIKESWANIKIQAGTVGEARAAYLPTLSGSVNNVNDRTSYPGSNIPGSSINSWGLNGGISWRLLDFGGREANRQAADSLLLAALLNHDYINQKTLSGLIQAYFDALTAKASWKSKTQNEEIAQGTLEVAQRREAKGAAAKSDTLQAATSLAKASLEKNRAKGTYQKAVSVLVYSIGIPTQTSIVLPDDLGEVTGQEVKELAGFMDDVQMNHPAIQASRAQVEAARQQVKVALSDGLPTIDFSANYYQNGRPGQSLTISRTEETTVGVTLNVPIFDGFSRIYKIRGAQAQVEHKEAELQDVEYQTLMELVKAHADATSALQNLQAADALLKAAKVSLEVSQRKYEKGAADILEMLNTQSALADAQMEHIRCQADWNSARLKLLASAGMMGWTAVDR